MRHMTRHMTRVVQLVVAMALLFPAASPGAAQGVTLKEARERLETEMIRQSLRKHAGRITTAALELGISRPTLYELMDKLGIEKSGMEKTE